MSSWIKPNDLNTLQQIMGDTYSFRLRISSGSYRLTLTNNTPADINLLTPIPTDNNWHFITTIFEGNLAKIYLNGEYKNQISFSGNLRDRNEDFFIGQNGVSAQYFNGSISDVRIYDRALSDMEINSLYTNSNLYNVTVSSTNYTDNVTLNHNLLTPLSVILEPFTLEAFNLITPSNTLTTDNFFNITWTEAVSPTGKPVSYFLNVTYPNGTVVFNTTTTDLYHNLNITDYEANDYNVKVTASELYTTVSYDRESTLSVDRTNYVYFFDEKTSDALTNKLVTIKYPSTTELSLTTDSEGKVNFSSYDSTSLQNGTYTFTYLGDLGYVSPITFNYTPDSLPFNESYNISRANLQIYIRDGETSDFVTDNMTVSITGIGTFTTTNGSLLLENTSFVSGEYTVFTSSENYTYVQRTFTYTNQEELTVTLFPFNKNTATTGTVLIRTYDSFSDVLGGVDIRVQEFDASTSSFVEVGQLTTNSNGEATFELLLKTRIYRFLATAEIDGVTYQEYSSTSGEILFLDEYVINIFFDTLTNWAEEYDENGLSVTVTNTTLINNVSYHQATFIDANGLDRKVCISYYYMDGVREVEYTGGTDCLTASSGTIQYAGGKSLDTNLTNIVKVYEEIGDRKVFYYVERYSGENSFAVLFADIIKPLIMVILLSALGLALYIKRVEIFVYLTVASSVIWGLVTPSYQSGGAVALTIVMGAMILYLAKARRGVVQ